jgi:hypothetical protein
MHHMRQENLPFVGSSHEFVGAEQGQAGVSVFLFHGRPGSGGKPGSGPGPHRHPCGRGKPSPTTRSSSSVNAAECLLQLRVCKYNYEAHARAAQADGTTGLHHSSRKQAGGPQFVHLRQSQRHLRIRYVTGDS